MPIVHVVATTFSGTRAALKIGESLARGLRTSVVLVVPRIVSSPAELGPSTDATDRLAERYAEIAREVGSHARVEVCRSVGVHDLMATLCATRAPVVVGGPIGRWLTSPEERFANRLARAGCDVIFVPAGTNTTQRRVAAA